MIGNYLLLFFAVVVMCAIGYLNLSLPTKLAARKRHKHKEQA